MYIYTYMYISTSTIVHICFSFRVVLRTYVCRLEALRENLDWVLVQWQNTENKNTKNAKSEDLKKFQPHKN